MLDHQIYDEEYDAEDDVSPTYLTFYLDGQTLGVEVSYVREILDCQRITRLPNAPMDVLGVVDVRGVSVPILDLKSRLGIPCSETDGETRIVVLEFGERGDPVGILADRVHKVDVIPKEEIEVVPSAGLSGWDAGNLHGLCRRDEDLVILLNITRIFAPVEIDFG